MCYRCLLVIAVFVVWHAPRTGAVTLVDAHVHYKWSQAEVTSPQRAVQLLAENQVELAVVIGTPPDLALKLDALAPDRIVPLFGPYRSSGEWHAWQFRDDLLDEARKALESGRFRGIGELHLIGGYAASWHRSPVLAGLLRLGEEFDVPLLLHVEFSRPDPMLKLCARHPNVKLVLAHAGAPMPANGVSRILKSCPNVWMELAARDNWRYVRNPIVDSEGRLLHAWETLVLKYPDRFIIGSDTVWPVDRLDSWDQPDTGWEKLGDFLAFHRKWAAFLPSAVADKVLRGNARELFLAR